MKQRRLIVIIIWLLVCMMLSAKHDGRSKMSRWVRIIADKESKDVVHTRGDSEEEPDNRMVVTFIQIGDCDADTLLPKYGGRKYAQLDDIVIAKIPLQSLTDLEQDLAVKRIEANESGMLTMDTTASVIGAQYCYEASDAHPAYTGKGVVVGVMDVGFDLTHPAFYDATRSHYRVGAFWDQLLKDTIDNNELPVGREFLGSEAVLAQQYSTDSHIQDHGSHTLGIIASGDTKYRGIAFDSDICLVSNAVSNDQKIIDEADLYMYTTATDAMGFKYLFDYADKKGMPCVVSFSEGYTPYLDNEDSLFSAFLGKLNAPGHIMMVSAGNENRNNTFFEKPAIMDKAGAFINTSKDMAFYRVKADGPMNLRLYAYCDNTYSPAGREQPWKNQTTKVDGDASRPVWQVNSDDERLEESLVDTFYVGTDTCVVEMERFSSKMVEEDAYYLLVQANKVFSEMPPLALVAGGLGTHVEVYGSSVYAFSNGGVDQRWSSATNGHNVYAPGCFESVICVGATTHRLSVLNDKGVPVNNSVKDKVTGGLADYSSVGPTMDGLLKPQVLAPGSNIVSAFSSRYLEEKPEKKDYCIAYTEHNGREYAWGANSGTSMAAPVAAGTVALWLQADPTLTMEDVLDIIRVTSRRVDENREYPNSLDGYGEIQAHAGLIEVLRRKSTGLDALSYSQPENVHIFIDGNLLTLSLDKPSLKPFRLRVYSLTGIMLLDQMMSAGQMQYSISLPAVSGVLALQLDSADKRLEGSMLVRLKK